MRLLLLLPLLLLLLTLTVQAAPKAPDAQPLGPALWYSWDWNDPTAFNAAQLQATGITGVLAVSNLKFDPQNRSLSLDELRTDAAAIKQRSGSLSVWWTFDVVRQVPPPRILYAPKDQAARTRTLDNYASIGRVAKEAGFPAVALDFESYGLSQSFTEKADQWRVIGVDVATALRRDNGGLRLAGLCPLSFYRKSDGARAFLRGYYGAAGSSGTFFNEDGYGLARQNVKALLADTSSFTHAQVPAAGWWPDGNSADPVATISAAAANVREAMRGGRPIMVYHEGPKLLGEDGRRGALKKVLLP